MKKTLILLAGYPGSGKTYLSNQIREMEHDFVVVSQDDIKEELFDQYGFKNKEEKDVVVERSRQLYYKRLERLMRLGVRIISDYPFSDKQKPMFETFAKKYDYKVLTIRLIADLAIVYKRRIKRDMSPDRHIAHLVNCYYPGMKITQEERQKHLISFEEFMCICNLRKYAEFVVGELIEIDASDFKLINYPQIMKKIQIIIS